MKYNYKQFPYVIDNNIITTDFKPLNSSDYKIVNDEVKKGISLAIVIQGPIRYEDNFTVETIKMYKKSFPGAKIILSTWKTEKENVLNEIEALDVIVLRNDVPEVKGMLNVNFQIKSSYEGLKKAKELNVEYAIKTRTDQRMYESNIAEYMHNLLKIFPLDKGTKKQKERLVTLSLNTFKYRLYDISDMFLFGHIDDVLAFWSCESEKRTVFPKYKTMREFCKYRPSEIYFTTEFLKMVGHRPTFTLKDSWKAYAKYFCVVDTASVGLIWPKYSNLVNRWRNFYGDSKIYEELTFKEWLNLYMGLDNKKHIPDEMLDADYSKDWINVDHKFHIFNLKYISKFRYKLKMFMINTFSSKKRKEKNIKKFKKRYRIK